MLNEPASQKNTIVFLIYLILFIFCRQFEVPTPPNMKHEEGIKEAKKRGLEASRSFGIRLLALFIRS